MVGGGGFAELIAHVRGSRQWKHGAQWPAWKRELGMLCPEGTVGDPHGHGSWRRGLGARSHNGRRWLSPVRRRGQCLALSGECFRGHHWLWEGGRRQREYLCGLEEQGELSLAWHLLQELL